MYWQLAVIAVAVLWLLQRLYLLISTPLEHLIGVLNLDIPRAATVSVDNVTDTAVHLHWDAPLKESDSRITSYLVYINGLLAASLNGRDLHCCMKRLTPSTKYRIDLITVNYKGYKAKSRPVYIKTKSTELQKNAQTILLENPETLFKLLTDNSDLSVQKLASTATSTATPNPTTADTLNSRLGGGRSRSNTVNSNFGENGSMAVPSINLLPDPKSIDDIGDLRYYLETGQEELHQVLNQQNHYLRDFKEQETLLLEEIRTLKERKRLEDGNRQSMKSEMKMLDDSRRLAELKKSKQEAALTAKEKAIQKMEFELDDWSKKTLEFEQERSQIEASEDKVHQELDSDIEKKKQLVADLQATVSSIMESVTQVQAQKKQREQIKPQLINIFKTLKHHTDKTGLLDAEGVQSLEALKNLEPTLWESVSAQVVTDSKLEAEWRAQQQREASHCTKASQQYEQLKVENQQLRTGVIPDRSTPTSLAPTASSAQGISMADASAMAYAMQTTNSTNNSSSNSFTNMFLSATSSPPNGTVLPQTQSSSLNPLQTSLWSNNSLSLGYQSKSPLSLNTKLAGIDPHEELDSPSVDHYLPTNLIGEELNGFDFPLPQEEVLGKNDSSGSGQGSTPSSTAAFMLPGTAPPSFAQTYNGNVSSRSIFHNEFNMSQPRYSLENASSPPQSFQNDFISVQNSPAANNDLSSIFSGGTADILPSFTQASVPESNKSAQKNPFSPRRLSSVFGFGKNRNGLDIASDIPTQSQPKMAQSKFFNVTSPDPPIFTLEKPRAESMNQGEGTFNILNTVWSSPSGVNAQGRSRSTSMHSSHAEKDDKSWSNFFSRNTNTDPNTLGVPSSANSVSSQAVSDANELGPVVQLTNTNRSTSNTVKSKSSGDSRPGSVSSPLLRTKTKKSKIFSFGHNNDRNPAIVLESPVKSNALGRTISPTKINSHEDGDEVEEYNPSATTTPMKLFSKRKSSTSQASRKQSTSSHETEGSLPSGQSGNFKSNMVRRLTFFKSNNGKELEETVNEEKGDEE